MTKKEEEELLGSREERIARAEILNTFMHKQGWTICQVIDTFGTCAASADESLGGTQAADLLYRMASHLKFRNEEAKEKEEEEELS